MLSHPLHDSPHPQLLHLDMPQTLKFFSLLPSLPPFLPPFRHRYNVCMACVGQSAHFEGRGQLYTSCFLSFHHCQGFTG